MGEGEALGGVAPRAGAADKGPQARQWCWSMARWVGGDEVDSHVKSSPHDAQLGCEPKDA